MAPRGAILLVCNQLQYACFFCMLCSFGCHASIPILDQIPTREFLSSEMRGGWGRQEGRGRAGESGVGMPSISSARYCPAVRVGSRTKCSMLGMFPYFLSILSTADRFMLMARFRSLWWLIIWGGWWLWDPYAHAAKFVGHVQSNGFAHIGQISWKLWGCCACTIPKRQQCPGHLAQPPKVGILAATHRFSQEPVENGRQAFVPSIGPLECSSETHTEFQEESLYASRPSPICWPEGILQWRGGVFFEPPPAAGILHCPPSCIHSPSPEGYFQGGGWGVGYVEFDPQVISKIFKHGNVWSCPSFCHPHQRLAHWSLKLPTCSAGRRPSNGSTGNSAEFFQRYRLFCPCWLLRKSLKKVLLGLPAQSLERAPKRPKRPKNDAFWRHFGDFSATFSVFSGLSWDSGLEGPGRHFWDFFFGGFRPILGSSGQQLGWNGNSLQQSFFRRDAGFTISIQNYRSREHQRGVQNVLFPKGANWIAHSSLETAPNLKKTVSIA